jgi:hypothetical protein
MKNVEENMKENQAQDRKCLQQYAEVQTLVEQEMERMTQLCRNKYVMHQNAQSYRENAERQLLFYGKGLKKRARNVLFYLAQKMFNG